MKNIFLLLLLQLAAIQLFSQAVIYEITNCNERRTALFSEQISNVQSSAKGELLFKKNLWLKFSPGSNINLDSLDIAAIPFRKAFPKNYWNQNISVIRLDTKPNEEGSIWFERVYVQENSKGEIKVVAALKVVFAGSDAEIERRSPKIQYISITSDPKVLKQYIAVIQRLKIANNIKSSDSIFKDSEDGPPPIRNL